MRYSFFEKNLTSTKPQVFHLNYYINKEKNDRNGKETIFFQRILTLTRHQVFYLNHHIDKEKNDRTTTSTKKKTIERERRSSSFQENLTPTNSQVFHLNHHLDKEKNERKRKEVFFLSEEPHSNKTPGFPCKPPHQQRKPTITRKFQELLTSHAFNEVVVNR